MQTRVPKQDQERGQDRTPIKFAFKCGVEVKLMLVYYSVDDRYELFIACDPDDEKLRCRMTHLRDVYEEGRNWSVYRHERYAAKGDGSWYDVYIYVAENHDSYDIRAELHECFITREYKETLCKE
jgi:hypothetical protein